MNNSATTRKISKIAVEYNGNDKGTARMVYSNNLLSENAEHQFKEMKAVANRNPKVKNWALTGYISPEKSIGDALTDQQLVDLTLKALRKVGVTEDNQIRLDIHNATKQKHIHFIVNRMNTCGKNTVKAHNIGERFGAAVREVCKEMYLKTDVEIGKEKKAEMLGVLKLCLKTAKSFEELVAKMHQQGYRVTLSENVKVGISGMRIVKHMDINDQTQREYLPGYKLSEITNQLKIKDIKERINKNSTKFNAQKNLKEKGETTETYFEENSEEKENGLLKNLFRPTYVSADDELVRKKKRNFKK
ncbi:relaxase/mobilization nuclease domain-containing protein [Capnocytophaga canimorsus]|uniref:relaxase/mobilization nuclease domain-containing protein n=1 Tax=Capnocytophaga canimorsus TaxID=28188 RepID=UPI001562160E|nr:relaxase/mobilization nuclease domain-containing protein [Capnocytophaga canimorsus]